MGFTKENKNDKLFHTLLRDKKRVLPLQPETDVSKAVTKNGVSKGVISRQTYNGETGTIRILNRE